MTGDLDKLAISVNDGLGLLLPSLSLQSFR